jgi:hypothetical protein
VGGNRSPHHWSRSRFSRQKGERMKRKIIKKHFTRSECKALETLWELDQLARQPNQQLIPAPTPKFSFIPSEPFFIPFDDMISGPIHQPEMGLANERVRTFVFTGWTYPWRFVVKVYLRSNGYFGKKKRVESDTYGLWKAEKVVIGWVEKVERVTKIFYGEKTNGASVVELGRIVKLEQQIPWPPFVDSKNLFDKKLLTKVDTIHHFDPPIPLKEYISQI